MKREKGKKGGVSLSATPLGGGQRFFCFFLASTTGVETKAESEKRVVKAGESKRKHTGVQEKKKGRGPDKIIGAARGGGPRERAKKKTANLKPALHVARSDQIWASHTARSRVSTPNPCKHWSHVPVAWLRPASTDVMPALFSIDTRESFDARTSG